MPRNAGSKYGIPYEGIPTTVMNNMVQKLFKLHPPNEYKLITYDASVDKPDNWRDVILDNRCVAFWNGERWIGSGEEPIVINWIPEIWAEFKKT